MNTLKIILLITISVFGLQENEALEITDIYANAQRAVKQNPSQSRQIIKALTVLRNHGILHSNTKAKIQTSTIDFTANFNPLNEK